MSKQLTQDFATLSGRELDKAFAQAIGYRSESPESLEPGDEVFYVLLDPNGGACSIVGFWTEAEAWETCPQFSTDEKLLGSVLAQIDAQEWRGFLMWSEPECHICGGDDDLNLFATGATVNEAACRAFLIAHAASQATTTNEQGAGE